MKTLTLDESLVDHLQRVTHENMARGEDHFAWLAQNQNESDRDQQVSETEQSINLDKRLLAMLDAPKAPERA